MLEQFQLAVCALGEHRRAEGLHDLLDGHGLVRELVFGRTARPLGDARCDFYRRAKYQTRPKAPMPTGCRSVYLVRGSVWLQRASGSIKAAPACDLKGRAEDLGTHEFSHGTRWCLGDGDGDGRVCAMAI